MLSLRKWSRVAMIAIAAAQLSPAFADDVQQQNRTEVRTQSGGIIRIVGPDGKVQERRFGTFAQPDHAEMLKKLQELQENAGDAEAVQRITKELMESMRQPAGLNANPFGAARPDLPKYGIGVSLAKDFPAALRKQLKLDESDGGVLVQSVAEGSPAEAAGIKESDVILAVDGKPITLPASLVDSVQAAGDDQKPLSLAVVSGGEHKTIEVTPKESDQVGWKLGAADEGDLNWIEVPDGFPGQAPMFHLRVPPGVIAGPGMMGGQPNGFMFNPLQNSQQLQERIEKLEAQLEQLNARLDKLAEKN